VEPDRAAFRRSFSAAAGCPAVSEITICEVPSNQPPWFDSGIYLDAGEQVSLFVAGRTYLSKPLDVWVGPQFQLWARVGETGVAFNGTRSSTTFTAEKPGRLFLASYFPGQWGDAAGRISTGLDDYASATGGFTVAVIRWKTPASVGLAALRGEAERSGEISLAQELAAGIAREANPPQAPSGWHSLWFLGASDVFSRSDEEIRCRTHENVAILQKETTCELTPETRIAWDWKVDSLPSAIAENAVLSHDYMSIAVEFNDGRDITYYWSSELAEETGYWCPLPTWKDREFHVVVRSGREGLGRWLSEERNLYQDYRRFIGEPPARIVRVWLIANSIFQRGEGICAYREMRLIGAAGEQSLP
jgi:hypothetical protein